MKILFLSYKFAPDVGGIEAHSQILANAFVSAGHDVHLLTWSKGKSAESFPFTVTRSPELKALLSAYKWADVVFENNPSVRLSWPLFFISRPSVVALHTWIMRANGTVSLLDKIKKMQLMKARRVIACSQAVRTRCWSKATVIPNPYQDHLFRHLPHVSKQKTFVFLGRLVSDKGVDLAIHAIHALLKRGGLKDDLNSEFTLTIIGDGPERKNLEMLRDQLDLGNSINFKGILSGTKLVECLNEHRFMLVPSIWEEPFGMVALEGMACGCVPIVSDGGGLPEAVGDAGLIFKRGNTESLVNVIKNVLVNQELERDLREKAKSHILRHSHDYVAKQYLNEIEAEF